MGLAVDVFRSGNISLLLLPATVFSLYNLCDDSIGHRRRIFWGCGHGVMHCAAALTCAIFIEWATEWSMETGIVVTKFQQSGNQTLGHSLYDTYSENFAEVFDMVTPSIFSSQEASDAAGRLKVGGMEVDGLGSMIFQGAYDSISVGGYWMKQNLPLLQGLMLLFDLPGLIGTKHADMCLKLCEGGENGQGAKRQQKQTHRILR